MNTITFAVGLCPENAPGPGDAKKVWEMPEAACTGRGSAAPQYRLKSCPLLLGTVRLTAFLNFKYRACRSIHK